MKKTKVRTSKILLWVVSAALVAILSVSLAFMGVALNRTKNLYKTDFSGLTGLASSFPRARPTTRSRFIRNSKPNFTS